MATVTAFEELCKGLCEIAGVEPPRIDAQGDGMVGFHVTWREVEVDVLYKPAASDTHAFILFDLGAGWQGEADPTKALLTLLQSNYLSLRVNPPTFSCHPESGAAILQHAFPLLETLPTPLFDMIDEGAAVALAWRESFSLSQAA